MTKCLSQLEKLLNLQDWKLRRLGNWLTWQLFHAIEHLPDKEESIFKVFKSSLLILFLCKRSLKCRKKISSMPEFQQKSKWTTFLDNLSSSKNPNILPIQLLQILLQELISKEKVYQPFWTPVCKVLSEKLLLPTKTDFVDLDSTLSNNWSTRQEETLRSFKVQKTNLLNKNLQKTFFPSFMSSLVDKWEKDPMPVVSLKTLKIKLYPTQYQKKVLDRFINTSRYVYNRTLEHINKGHKVNFQNLRDLLVTDETQKCLDEYKYFDNLINLLKKQRKDAKDEDETKLISENLKIVQQNKRNFMKNFDFTKNPLIHDFELETPKDIRSCAVKRCCDAFKTGFTNLKNGNIRHFRMKYKKKTEKSQSFEATPKLVSIDKGYIKMTPTFFEEKVDKKKVDHSHIKVHKKITKVSKIEHNVDIVKIRNEYFIHIPIETDPTKTQKTKTIAGVDPGIRTFATVFSHNKETNVITEYKHRSDLLRKLNLKINLLKTMKGKHVRKKHIAKREKEKNDIVDMLHWDFINNLLSENDVVYLGDIKSHDIVKGGKNSTLNQAFNDLKFHVLKQRLLYKAYVTGKKVYMVPEHYTTKTCSCCGKLNNHIGSKEVFECDQCSMITGRDMNASKNMLMKGLML
jgi:IS605 OrfB family transposase